ncbi:MAG: hypothetical protein P8X91_07840, partial [Candidatus Bathyarchaeota archaeon]
MEKTHLKSKISMIALILVLTISTFIAILPISTAQVPPGMTWDFPGSEDYTPSDTRLYIWERWGDTVPTHVFLAPAPDPVGVNQLMTFVMYQPQVPPGARIENDIKWYG